MYIIFTLLCIASFLGGKYLFQKWVNPLSSYTFIWFGMIFLFQLKLIRYHPLSNLTWSVILLSFLCFILGILLFFSARSVFFDNKKNIKITSDFLIFEDGGKILKITIIIFATIGLLATLQHWYILINQFGDLQTIFINAGIVYRLRVNREIEGAIPYIQLCSYVAFFYGAIYTTYKRKITIYLIYPFFAIILEEIAIMGRAGLLLVLIEFLIIYFLVSYKQNFKKDKIKVKNNRGNVSIILIILLCIILSASLVRLFRGTVESNIKGSTKQLNQLSEGFIISPSVYLYLSGNVGVLNKYLQMEKEENKYFGENTFLMFYSILSKFNIVKRPSDYQKGYFMPIWSNTGTYLREIHADFGIFGVLIIPLIISFLTSYYWFNYLKKQNLFSFTILVFLLIVIFFSWIAMATRLAIWMITFLILLVLNPVLEKLVLFRKNYIYSKKIN